MEPASTEETRQADLVQHLMQLGVQRDDVLLVHTAFSRVKPIEGGPTGLIRALLQAVGPAGTLVMPSMTDDDERPFDPKTAPCKDMGIVADTFWRQPGVVRSDSPHAFAAIGPKASEILAPHPVDVPHGLDSPVGRVHGLDGRILLLGVNHEADTTIHLAESLAGVRYRLPRHATVLKDGKPTRVDYLEIDHCCARFDLADGWLDERGLQRKGMIGRAEARLARSRDIVAVVLEHLTADETTFLHPHGVDAECDEARAGIGS
jgi:aminoglycoside 3-N-acetyltransferase